MSIPPPLRKLQYVLAVAQELHFRRAAERLNISQPYVSRQIKEFEADIGFDIFLFSHSRYDRGDVRAAQDESQSQLRHSYIG